MQFALFFLFSFSINEIFQFIDYKYIKNFNIRCIKYANKKPLKQKFIVNMQKFSVDNQVCVEYNVITRFILM